MPRQPLAARLRPTSLDDVVGQEHLLGPGRPLRALIESDRLSSVVLWGPAGVGKTTLARLIAGYTSAELVALSAVNAGVKDVRETIEGARKRRASDDQATILFLDEVHRFNKAQQDALLPSVEDGTLVLIGATTENPYFEVNPPLLSRSVLFRLEPLADDAVRELVRRGLEDERATAEPEAVDGLVTRAGGDGRQALTVLEVAVALARSRAADEPVVAVADVEAALGTRLQRYGRDDHYDVISAFIKSIRGSDVDAGLYWLAKMLQAGEDARYIARRLVVLASEDVGMAQPMALVVADAAARAVEFVGLPEAQLNLAHAVIYLASCPKSNTVADALAAAMRDVTHPPQAAGEVPRHLKDAHYLQGKHLGHGKGYVYPHNHPDGWVPQQYRPEGLEGRVYYEPSPHGREPELTNGWLARTRPPKPIEEPEVRR